MGHLARSAVGEGPIPVSQLAANGDDGGNAHALLEQVTTDESPQQPAVPPVVPRLARRERDLPIPNPDTPQALAATLVDWGAEYRPQDPCPACGTTLYWTAAGADMCARCLPLPRISDKS